MFRNAELRSRPAFGLYLPGPDGSNPILAVGSFLSKNLVWHTVAFTISGMFQLSGQAQILISQGHNPWIRLGGPPLSSANPVAIRTFQNILYYTNGSGHLSAWDGSVGAPIQDVAFTGGTYPLPNNYAGATYSSLFLGELDSHLIMSYTTELTYTAGSVTASTTYPQRIRWSNIGFNPTLNNVFGGNLGTAGATWDTSINLNAGSNDFLDVTDIITGQMFLGRMGYLFRQNGITEINPTGNGLAPFDFNHLWASEHGIGNVYPETIAQYGSYGAFISTDNIYQITPGNVNAIGKGARDAIMLDLSLAVAPPTACIVDSYATYRVYLAYKLLIPMPDGSTRIYLYSFEDANWTRWSVSGVTMGTPVGCWIGDSQVTNQILTTGR
jgi:hypothetical protein